MRVRVRPLLDGARGVARGRPGAAAPRGDGVGEGLARERGQRRAGGRAARAARPTGPVEHLGHGRRVQTARVVVAHGVPSSTRTYSVERSPACTGTIVARPSSLCIFFSYRCAVLRRVSAERTLARAADAGAVARRAARAARAGRSSGKRADEVVEYSLAVGEGGRGAGAGRASRPSSGRRAASSAPPVRRAPRRRRAAAARTRAAPRAPAAPRGPPPRGAPRAVRDVRAHVDQLVGVDVQVVDSVERRRGRRAWCGRARTRARPPPSTVARVASSGAPRGASSPRPHAPQKRTGGARASRRRCRQPRSRRRRRRRRRRPAWRPRRSRRTPSAGRRHVLAERERARRVCATCASAMSVHHEAADREVEALERVPRGVGERGVLLLEVARARGRASRSPKACASARASASVNSGTVAAGSPAAAGRRGGEAGGGAVDGRQRPPGGSACGRRRGTAAAATAAAAGRRRARRARAAPPRRRPRRAPRRARGGGAVVQRAARRPRLERLARVGQARRLEAARQARVVVRRRDAARAEHDDAPAGVARGRPHVGRRAVGRRGQQVARTARRRGAEGQGACAHMTHGRCAAPRCGRARPGRPSGRRPRRPRRRRAGGGRRVISGPV